MLDPPSAAQVTTDEILPGVVVARDELWLLFALVVLWATVGRWLYRDARSRGNEWAWQWGFGTPLTVVAGIDVMLLVVVIYLLLRDSE
ncbi:hypothetical protein DQW50_10755 [Halorubrum sp. 48-1-W]|uniref:hypothetical protein n=1 Tax=Halorubrum sp. 48-1-W TaxID=2249761 RepID=UPI000DCE3892|nr:hypothetical protein [Halorubrum sp. 48-1-W]RAW45114.1 hypothetical protein DQW50_10755 [Halorubrum sp. 48-1-W]